MDYIQIGSEDGDTLSFSDESSTDFPGNERPKYYLSDIYDLVKDIDLSEDGAELL